jgi:hypothetical protein
MVMRHSQNEFHIEQQLRSFTERLHTLSEARISYYHACLTGDHDAAEMCHTRLVTLEFEFSIWLKHPDHPESSEQLRERLRRSFRHIDEKEI